MIRRRAVALGLAVAAGLGPAVLGGCTPSTSGAEVATLDGGGGDGAGTTTTLGPAKDPKEAALEFARCMREHGVDMPDPDVSGDGGIGITVGGEGARVDAPAVKAAEAACKPALDAAAQQSGRHMDPAEEARMRENALAFARCMREHGIDMPDPTFEGGGMVKSELGQPGGGGPGPDSPAFQEAEKTCQDQVGDMGPGRMRTKRVEPGAAERGNDGGGL